MIRKIIKRLKDNKIDENIKTQNFCREMQDKVYESDESVCEDKDCLNETINTLNDKIKKSNIELDMIYKKQKKFIWLSLLLYGCGAVFIILFNKLLSIPSVVSAFMSLGYIILGNIAINPIAKKFSNSICEKLKEIKDLKLSKDEQLKKKNNATIIDCECKNIKQLNINDDANKNIEEVIENIL